MILEAIDEGCQRLVAGGGDETVNEVANALLNLPAEDRSELAVLPLGTANVYICILDLTVSNPRCNVI